MTALQDRHDEENETVVVDILSVSGDVEDGDQQVTVSIVDDDENLASIDFTTTRTDATSNTWTGDGDIDGDGADDGVNVITILTGAEVVGDLLNITEFEYSFDHPSGGTVVTSLTGSLNMATGAIALNGYVASSDTPGIPALSLVRLDAQASPIGEDAAGRVDGTITITATVNIAGPVIPAPIAPDGNVAGAETDIVINLDRSSDPNVAGRTLLQGKTIKVTLPEEFINTGTPSLEDIFGADAALEDLLDDLLRSERLVSDLSDEAR